MIAGSGPVARLLRAFSARENLRLLAAAPPGRLGPVDGLRALSIVWVVLFHAGWFARFYIPHARWTSLLQSPWMLPVWRGDFGVDLFFVLSGFLIGGLLLDELRETGHIGLGRFYARRLLRLWPALVAVVVLSVATQGDPHKTAWATLLYLTNLLPVDRMALGWTWSLALEEQFYLLCPWLLLLLVRLPPRGRLAAALALVALLVAVTAQVVVSSGLRALDAEIVVNLDARRWAFAFDRLYDKPWTRGGALLLGVTGALALRTPRLMEALGASRLGGALGLAAALALMAAATHWPLALGVGRPLEVLYLATFRTCFAAGATWLLLLALSDSPAGRRLGRWLSSPLLYPIAQLAYAAYLLNPLVCAWVHPRLAPLVARGIHPMLLFVPADLGATFAAALVLHLLIERPFMRLRPERPH